MAISNAVGCLIWHRVIWLSCNIELSPAAIDQRLQIISLKLVSSIERVFDEPLTFGL
jgi:hypothetical protein